MVYIFSQSKVRFITKHIIYKPHFNIVVDALFSCTIYHLQLLHHVAYYERVSIAASFNVNCTCQCGSLLILILIHVLILPLDGTLSPLLHPALPFATTPSTPSQDQHVFMA